MRHFLTNDQFSALWDSVPIDLYKISKIEFISNHTIAATSERQNVWNKHYKDKYGLLYSEMWINNEPQWCVIGTEDKINWLLIQI